MKFSASTPIFRLLWQKGMNGFKESKEAKMCYLVTISNVFEIQPYKITTRNNLSSL